MGTEPEKSSRRLYRIEGLKIVVAVIFLPLLPLAVALNFLGTADQLSSLPGIRKGGGVVASIVAFVYVACLVGVVSAGGMAIMSDGPDNEGPPPSPTSTATPTPSPTPTANPMATSTPTATPTPSDAELREDYESLRQRYLEHWSYLDEDHPATPALLGTDVRADQDALWIVFDETDVFENESRMRDEWTTVANAYGHALRNHTGHATDYMIAVGWNNTGPITYFRVETDDVQAYFDREIDYNTFYNRFFRTVRATNDAERSIARDIAEHPPDDN